LHTNLVTNGTLLESRIDEIAPYINGVVYVSLDGLEKTHDMIRGVTGCFRKTIRGVIASREKVSVTINTTIMTDNLYEIEEIVKLAKELHTGISVAVAHEYCSANGSAPTAKETAKIAKKLIEMKNKGYPLVNSVNYFRVVAHAKSWKCRPWAAINVDPKGSLVLPCYVRNEYSANVPILETNIKTAISRFNWKETQNCEECSLHCYVEPSLVLSSDFLTNLNWIFRVRI
jgi:MoaA/NifB/PqqE/SkfB family radical SAM enzyme